jgi:hypothetical protein
VAISTERKRLKREKKKSKGEVKESSDVGHISSLSLDAQLPDCDPEKGEKELDTGAISPPSFEEAQLPGCDPVKGEKAPITGAISPLSLEEAQLPDCDPEKGENEMSTGAISSPSFEEAQFPDCDQEKGQDQGISVIPPPSLEPELPDPTKEKSDAELAEKKAPAPKKEDYSPWRLERSP